MGDGVVAGLEKEAAEGIQAEGEAKERSRLQWQQAQEKWRVRVGQVSSGPASERQKKERGVCQWKPELEWWS